MTRSDAPSGRSRLLDVACDLFLDSGYDGVSIQQIADAAGMTKASPYYHFRNKEDLFVHAFRYRSAKVLDGVEDALVSPCDLRERLVAAFTFLLTNAHPGFPRLFEDVQRILDRGEQPDASNELLSHDRILEIYRRAFQDAVQTGMTIAMSPVEAADLITAFQMGTLQMQHLQRDNVLESQEAKVLAARTIDCFFDGMLVR